MSSSGSQGKQPVPGLVETVNQNHHQEETDEMAEALGSLDLTSYTCEQVSNWAEKKEVIEHKPELNSGGSNEANSPGAADSNILSNSVESSSHVAGKTNKEDNSPTATESEIDPDSSAESEIDSDSSAESPEDSSSLNDGLLQSSRTSLAFSLMLRQSIYNMDRDMSSEFPQQYKCKSEFPHELINSQFNPAASHSCFGASQPSTMQCSQGTAQALPPSNSRLQAEKSLNCPRCNSTNTKFCYYNNYSLQQPRYFCKTCRRYWTEGGSLRNVPVGGGSRKNKRSSSSSTSPAPASLPVGVGPAMGPHQDINLALLPHHHHGRGPNPGALSEPPRSTSYLPPTLVSPGMPIEHGADLWSALSEVRRWSPLQVPSALGPTMNTHDSGSDGAWLTPGLRGVTRESAGGRFLFPFEFLKPAMSADDGGANDGARESATGRLFFPFEDGDVLPPVASADGGASDDGNNGAQGRMLDDGGERVKGESAADKGSDNGGGGRAD